jgi:chloramphenicol O-acetyltransferase type A
MNYKIIEIDKYYRKNVYLRFVEGPKCSISMTYKLDITKLYNVTKSKGKKINIALLYLVTKTVNSRDDYKMYYDFRNKELRCYDVFDVTHYVFDQEKETCKMVRSKFNPNYDEFYKTVEKQIEEAKNPEYQEDNKEYPNCFDASAMPRISYDSFDLELPDGYLYFNPIINWGRFIKEDEKVLLPITIRMNHAIADGYLLSKFFLIMEEYIKEFNSK